MSISRSKTVHIDSNQCGGSAKVMYTMQGEGVSEAEAASTSAPFLQPLVAEGQRCVELGGLPAVGLS